MIIILIVMGTFFAIASSVIKANNKGNSNKKVSFILLIVSIMFNTVGVYFFIETYVL